MSQDFFASSYATGTDSWSSIPLLPDLMTVMNVVPKSGLVLDMGTGRGKIAMDLAQSGYRVVGIDTLAGPVSRATKVADDRGLSQYAKFMVADATATGFSDASFDAVIEIGLLQHMNPELRSAVIAESSRVLKPGGHFISVVLSRETKQFLDFRPLISADGNFSRFGLDYHFFTNNEMKAEVQSRFSVLTQFVAEYQTTAYGANALSFLYTVSQKPQSGITANTSTDNSAANTSATAAEAHDAIFA